ncbi:MAG: hypothetical protein AAF436_21230 [Myxococcota bacterium]
MKAKTKIALTLAAGAFSLSLFARAQPPDGSQRERRGPPPEAIEACVDLSVGEACIVDTPHGTLEGVCREGRRGNELVCVPNDHRDRPPRRDD